MSNPIPMTPGDLVKTADDYYAIILFFEGDEAGVFLCNGLATVVKTEELVPLSIHEGPSHANFSELIAAHLRTPFIETEVTRCPKALDSPS